MPDSRLRFIKMQGTGNDFVVWDNRDALWSVDYIATLAPTLCDRHFGIGGDGVIVLAPSEMDGADYQMIFRNPDGSDAGMCGNGGRCIARLAHTLGYPAKHSFHVHDNIYHAKVDPAGVEITFPMEPRVERHPDFGGYPLYEVNPGTEHMVLITPAELMESKENMRTIAREIRYNKSLALKGCNVNFAHLIEPDVIQLMTYERGVEDFTLSCGTGAIATALASFAHAKPTSERNNMATLQIQPEGGNLDVTFLTHLNSSENIDFFSKIALRGPAEFVFTGEIDLPSE